MAEIVVTPRADRELRAIWRYIAEDSPAAADQLLLKIDEKLQLLGEFPGIGTTRDDIRPGARMLVIGPYLVLYEFQPQQDLVLIVTIVDGRRDLNSLP